MPTRPPKHKGGKGGHGENRIVCSLFLLHGRFSGIGEHSDTNLNWHWNLNGQETVCHEVHTDKIHKLPIHEASFRHCCSNIDAEVRPNLARSNITAILSTATSSQNAMNAPDLTIQESSSRNDSGLDRARQASVLETCRTTSQTPHGMMCSQVICSKR